MGAFSVKARVWNPPELSSVLDVELIVDTGATYTVLPAETPEGLGIGALTLSAAEAGRFSVFQG